jgi:anti-sigma factor RsiW
MSEVSCARCIDLLGEYVDGRLGPDVQTSFEIHLANCAACARLARDYRAIPYLLRRGFKSVMPKEAEARLRRLIAKLAKGTGNA